MSSHQALKDSIHRLSINSEKLNTANEKVKALLSAVEVANEIVKILDPNINNSKHGDDVLEDIISTNTFRNTKMEDWFSFHPIYPDERLALKLFESDVCEMKFYWLNNNSTKARISAGVMLTPNWEDNDTTKNDDYKVGVDFFLKKDAKSLLMVISHRGSLRVMEFSERLTHTQEQILDKITGALSLTSRKAFHSVLWESMALSEVNKQFYQGIAHHFTVLYQHLVKTGKNHEDSKLFASRLLSRLLFIWFLRKKNVIYNEDRYFPDTLSDSTEYYSAILKPLFFQTLNTPIYNRKNGDMHTPYLNGGLFDAHDNDWPYEQISFPKNYFADFYEHLDKYNFTTDESSPDYEQVAIDPEMLGRVFESLLTEQLTDTGEQARKAKGTFYTPREIVSYMCKESLRQYLYTQLGDEKYYTGVDKLIDSPDYEWEAAHSNAKRDLWPFENATKFIPKIIGILDSLTILDPACGSGAFPIGMLQLLLKTYERLDSRFAPYETKLKIIQNNIFGVDIEPMAVEISRLRAWLAIIVDDEGQIDPLPNLDFKFVCANGLIPLEESVGLWDDQDLERKMSDLREKFFNARTPKGKEDRKKEYYKLTSSQNSMFAGKRHIQIKSFDPFKNQHPADFFDSRYMFGVEEFDIVIGNPPYVHLEKIKDIAKEKYLPLNFKTYEARGDLYGLFFERYIESLKENGILSFITSNKWMRAGYGQSLRNYFVNHTQPLLLIDLGGGIFESATVDTDILILKKTKYSLPTKAITIKSDFDVKNISDYIKQSGYDIFFKFNENWTILSPIEQRIKEKIERFGTPLKDWDIKINRGVLTGCNEAFIIDEQTRAKLIAEDSKSAEIIRPILRGKDIKKNGYEFAGLYLITTHNGYRDSSRQHIARIQIEDYPAIKEWLESEVWNNKPEKGTSIERLRQRTDKGETLYNLRDCAYMDDFSKQKILYSEIVQSPQFYLDSKGFIPEATAFLMFGEHLDSLIKYMNSDIVSWIFKTYYAGGGLGESGYRYKKAFLTNLPVPRFFDNKLIDEDKIVKLYHFDNEEENFIKSSL